MEETAVIVGDQPFLVHAENAIRMLHFKLPNGDLYRILGWFDTAPRRPRAVEPTTLEAMWEFIPTLQVKDPERFGVPDYFVEWEGVQYTVEIIPWAVVRIIKPNGINLVLSLTWVKDDVNWYRVEKAIPITSPGQVLNLVPEAIPA